MTVSATLRSAAALLVAQADMADIAAEHDIQIGPSDVFGGVVIQLPAAVPPEFYAFTPANPYGARADIGSPNNQAILRAYAIRDGFADLNHYIKGTWRPIWPDAKLEPSPGYAGDQS